MNLTVTHTGAPIAAWCCCAIPGSKKQSYTLTIDLPAKVPVNATSVYPEQRVYGTSLVAGQSLEITLAPYETVVLSVTSDDVPPGLTDSRKAVENSLARSLTISQTCVQRVVYDAPDQPLGDDFTSLAPDSGQTIEIDTAFQLHRTHTDTRLRILALLEGKTVPEAVGVMTADGQEIALQSARSDAGFSATGAAVPESWHFLQGTIPPAAERVALHVVTEDPAAAIAIWVWEDRPGQVRPASTSRLPEPESVSLASACVLPHATVECPGRTAPVGKRGED